MDINVIIFMRKLMLVVIRSVYMKDRVGEGFAEGGGDKGG